MKLFIMVVSLASCYTICQVQMLSWLPVLRHIPTVQSSLVAIKYTNYLIYNTIYIYWKIKYINIDKYVCCMYKNNHVPAKIIFVEHIVCTEATCNLKTFDFCHREN
jgi:hypothetical protein